MGAPSSRSMPGRGLDALAAGATFAILLGVYAATACPTVFTSTQATDSGELITAIHVLGVSHPTGYPLYMLLGRLFEALLPIGEVAYRLNLLSAVLAAAAGALICGAVVTAGGSRPAGVLGGVGAGLFLTVWEEANYAEVYALNMLLVALAWWAFCRWSQARSSRSLVWLAAAGGLGLAHHRTALFISGPLLIAALALHRPLGWKTVAKGAAAFLAPLLLYLYLPLRAAANPPANWGDCATLSGFWQHVSGALYTPYVFARRGHELSEWLGGAARQASAQIGWVGLGFAFLGGAWMIRRRRALGVCLAAGFVLTLVWSATYAAGDSTVFVLPCYLILGWWLAAAADGVGGELKRLAPASARMARAGAFIAPALMVLLPAALVSANWAKANKRNAWQGDEWARTVFAQFLPRSLALLTGDSANGIAEYYQVVKGQRRDVTILSADHANHEWYVRRIADQRLREVALEAIRLDMRNVRAWRSGLLESLPSWQGALAYAVATQYPGRLPMHTGFEVPGLPAGFWVEDRSRPHEPFFTITTAPPPILRGDRPGARAVPLQFGISVLGARGGRGALERGRAAPIWLEWRCQEAVEGQVEVAVSLVAAGLLQMVKAPPPAEIAEGQAWGFSVTTPFVFGLRPLEATPAGRHYAQDVWVVPPRALIPGRYIVRVAVGGKGWQAGPVSAGEAEIR